MTDSNSTGSSGIGGRLVVTLGAAVLYAYPFWTALGNLLNLPAYFASQFGASANSVPWALLIAGVALPVVIFVLAIVTSWRRGSGALALALVTGFAVVNSTALSILAFEKEVELRLVIEFLTGG